MNELPNTPSFMEGIAVTEEEAAYYEAESSNWVKLHKSFGDWDETKLLKCLLVEVVGKNRHDMVSRLRKRFELVRQDRENMECQNMWSENASLKDISISA